MTTFEAPEMNPLLSSEQTPSKRNRTGIIAAVLGSIVVAITLVISILLVKNAQTADAPQPTPQPSSTAKQLSATERAQTGISLGKDLVAGTTNEGATQVDIYFDYACSHCNHLGNDYGAGLGEAAKAGDITLVYHPVAIMGTLFSYTGAGAEFFVADNEPDKYFAFHELLHEKIMTPYMNGDLQDPRAKDIVAIAKEAGVSEENCEALSQELTEMEDILLNSDHSRSNSLLERVVTTSNTFVNDSMEATGSAGTPTVYIDGEKAESWSADISNLLNK